MNRPAQLVWKQPTRWWFALLLIVVTTAAMRSYGLATWPWEYDELASFMELGLYPPEEHSDYQLRTIVKFVPVWYALQHAFLSVLPHDELGSRILPALCGTLTVVGLSAFAYYHRGLGLAVALAVLVNGNVLLLHLSQVNRFYTLPLLFVALAMMGIWARSEGFVPLAVTVGCAAMAMLSHSLALIPFGIAALASTATWLLGWGRRATAVRALSAAAVAGLIYLAWVRPNMEGWLGSAPQPGLHTLMSFASYLGIPTLALGLFGAAAALVHREARSDMAWWAISAAGVLLFMLLVPWLMPIWHPPYHLLFMLPFWITGAFAVDLVARRLASPRLSAAWYGCVIVLLLPGVVSHYRDGSRADYRAAAQVVASVADREEPIYASDVLRCKYYLPPELRDNVRAFRIWEGERQFGGEACILAYESSAFAPVPQLPRYSMELLALIGNRRFDERSVMIRVFRLRRLEPANR